MRQHLAHALFHGRDELPGDGAALDLVDELEAAAARQRLDAQEHLAELAGAAGLLLVAVVAFGRRRDGLAVGDARRTRVDLELVGLAQPLQQHAQVQFAQAVDDGLVGAGHVLHLQARVLVDQLGQDLPHALLVAAALGRSPGRAPAPESPAASGGCGRPRRRRAARRRSASRRPWPRRTMSPGMALFTSTWSLPCSMNRWPTLKGLRPSPTYSWLSLVTVPWCTRKMPILPTYGSTVTLKTWASTCCAGSGVACMGTAASPSPFRKSGGLPSVGLGSSLTMMSSSSATPAPLRAETKHTGIRWPSRSACSSGACSSEASTSPSFR
jgi:hypothetical protein